MILFDLCSTFVMCMCNDFIFTFVLRLPSVCVRICVSIRTIAGSGADRVASDGHLPAGGKAQPLAQSQPQPQAGLRPMQMKVQYTE